MRDEPRRQLVGRRQVIIQAGVAGAAALASPIDAAANVTPVSFKAPGTRIEMTIDFTKDRTGARRGMEQVSYTFNADGTMSMSARSESFDPPVVRHVIYLLGPDLAPRSCHVQVTDAGRHAGSAHFRLSRELVELEGMAASGARISQRRALRRPVRALVAHPVSSDVHVGMAADRSRPGEPIEVGTVYLTSADPYGRGTPEITAADVAVAYVGAAMVATPAGQLPGDHYLLYLRTKDGGFAPFQDLWCLAGTPVFLKAYARPPIATRYEITGLRIIAPGAG